MTQSDATALSRTAIEALRARRYDDARMAYVALLSIRPQDADAWFNLGWLHRRERRFAEALDAYGHALTHGVRRPDDAHVNRAAILSDHLRRDAEAIVELHAALAANPSAVIAYLNLGLIHEDRGEQAEARAAYASVLRLIPGDARATARLAMLNLAQGDPAGVVPALRAALDRPHMPRDDAAELGFALGHALDATGAYDAAFTAFTQANTASRAMAGAAGIYDRDAHERLINAIIATFDRPVVGPADRAITPPIFICGMFRSGSTLAEQILAAHPRVRAAGELESLPALVAERLQPYPQAAADLSSATYATLADAYMGEVRHILPDADVVTDKRPDNFLYIGLIKAMFPNARIVHTRRDPLDNLLSIHFLHFQHSVAYGFALDDAAHWYAQYRRLMAHWESLYPNDIFTLDYDAMVAEPEPSIRALVDFCGLEWDGACLAHHTTRTVVRTPSAWQVRRPIHTRSSRRWRNYATYLTSARAILQL